MENTLKALASFRATCFDLLDTDWNTLNALESFDVVNWVDATV